MSTQRRHSISETKATNQWLTRYSAQKRNPEVPTFENEKEGSSAKGAERGAEGAESEVPQAPRGEGFGEGVSPSPPTRGSGGAS